LRGSYRLSQRLTLSCNTTEVERKDSADAKAPTGCRKGKTNGAGKAGGFRKGGYCNNVALPDWTLHNAAGIDRVCYTLPMIIAAILLGLCQIVTTFGACLLLRRFINAKQAEIEAKAEASLRAWIDLQGENHDQPSKLALMLDGMGAVVGSAAARSLMNSIKQPASAAANVANGIAEPMIAQQNPLLAMLTTGKRGKGAAVLRLAELLGGMLGKPVDSGNGASSVSVRDRLR